jgi:HAD superfamily hydrolase (TIGR01509 family)
VTKRDTPWSLYNVAEANIDPGSAVVVDDRPENIARAAELGFRTFLFRTVGYT